MEHHAYTEGPYRPMNRRVVEDYSASILPFTLDAALPDGYSFSLNITLGTFSLLYMQDALPRQKCEQQFTRGEMSMLLPLLDNYPYYCPYEVLYASFYSNDMSDKAVDDARTHLQKALNEGQWDQEMRPIRTLLSRTRFKARLLGLDILSVLETGYILRYLPAVTPHHSQRVLPPPLHEETYAL